MNGDNMKNRELFLDKINIDDTFSMQIDQENQEELFIYENNVVIDVFSLRKRIYTLFKVLQELTNTSELIDYKEKKAKLYGKEIHVIDDIYMQLTNKHENLIVEFNQKINNENKLLYLTKTNYMTQKLFHMMLIPKKVIEDPDYKTTNPKLFKDLIDVLSVIKI